MPYDGVGTDITIPAGSDLSTYQYRFVKLDASGYATPCSAKGDHILGILQNKPAAAGRAARVRTAGISLMYHSATASPGDLLGPCAVGGGTTTTTDSIGAVALAGVGGSGDIASVLVRLYEV